MPNLEMADRPQVVYGLAAMDVWIDQMKKNSFVDGSTPASAQSKSGARATALLTYEGARIIPGYLRSQAGSFPEGARRHIDAAAEAYSRIAALLRPALTGEGGERYEDFVGDVDKQKAHAENILVPVKRELGAAADAMSKALGGVQ